MAVAIAFSSKVARLCTMPIQFPETCTTARWLSIRTSRACCDSSMRVEGSSRLARICCQSSPRSSLGAGVVAAVSAGGSDAAACEGGVWALDVSGRLTAGTPDELSAVEATAVEAMAAEATAGAGAGADVGTAAEATGTAELNRAGAGDEVAGLVAAAGSASKPSSSTSSHRRG